MKLVLLALVLCICLTLNVEAKKGCKGWTRKLSPFKKEVITSHQDFNVMGTEYSANQSCRWEIEASENKVPEIVFNTFVIGKKPGICDGDVVKIWSGDNRPNTRRNPHFEFCGVPKGLAAVTGTGKYMIVIFTTNESNQNRGFSADVIERNPGCPALKDNVVKINPVFGIECEWSFQDSIDLNFSKFSLKDDDSISIYKTTGNTMSIIKSMNGSQLNEKGINLIQDDSGILVYFFSAPNLWIPDINTYGFSFNVVYNCRNFELIYVQLLVVRSAAEAFCRSNGTQLDLAIIDKQCKKDILLKKYKEVCDSTHCPRWFGLTGVKNGNFTWANGKPLIESESQWMSNEPNNKHGDEFCVEMRTKNNQRGWNDEDCKLHRGFFCSRLTRTFPEAKKEG